MGQHTVCEAILPGPWRLRPGVICAALPAAQLETTGVAHVKMPEDLIRKYSYGGEMVDWLARVKDAEKLQLGEDNWFRQYLTNTFPSAQAAGSFVQRVDWEWNNWHYDIISGLTDDSNYDIQGSVGPRERANRRRQSFLCTIPFPVDWQGPTVTAPWAGEYAGKRVQAPRGYATIFDQGACWHRGDRWLGSPRGVFRQVVSVETNAG